MMMTSTPHNSFAMMMNDVGVKRGVLFGASLLFVLCSQIVEGWVSRSFRYQWNHHHGGQKIRCETKLNPRDSSLCKMVGDARGDYYGESGGSYMVKEFSMFEDLQEIVKLAAQSLPERPDGIVCVCKYTSAEREDCRATEAEYERIARANPATIFLRCFAEYDNAHLLLAQAKVTTWPTFDLFYGGNRVARVEGANYPELEDLLQRYQFINSELDLFSERADQKRKLKWGDGKAKDASRTPRTTNRFLPGYDWNSDRGFFDGFADKLQADFETQFENWIPNVDDDDKKKK